MTTRKIFGSVFIVIALLLTLAILGRLSEIVTAIVGIFKIFSGQLDGYPIGIVIMNFIYWVLHIFLANFLWITGKRWTKK